MKENIREPNFELEEDMFVFVTDQKQAQDSTTGLVLRANVLIFSYNRPRMLKEAIESVLNQSYGNFDLYIVDDGSDKFDPNEILEYYADSRILLAQAPKISMEERMRASRLGSNANAVIEQIPNNEPVYYLCDDDIMAPLWLARSTKAFEEFPDTHVVQGESWYFHDGQNPYTDSIYGLEVDKASPVPTMYWSTGSFAHKALCCKEEGLWWSDNTYLHSQDTNFIMDFWNSHSNYGVVPTPAVYRREHKNTLSAKLGRKDEKGKYQVGYVPPPATQQMLEEMED